jgi:hypothetical protein
MLSSELRVDFIKNFWEGNTSTVFDAIEIILRIEGIETG